MQTNQKNHKYSSVKKVARVFGANSPQGRPALDVKATKRNKQSELKKKQFIEAIGTKSRAAAAQIVNSISEGKSLSDSFNYYCAHYKLDMRDTSFVKEIVYGTLRHRRILMATLKPMFDYKITERHRIVQSLLLTAIYQIIFMRAPAHAVVAATVGACSDCSRKGFTALVNAILRRFLREGAKLAEASDVAIKNSFPDWLFTRIQNAYPHNYQAILQASNEKAPIFLRVELSKISRDDYLELLKKANIEAQKIDICNSAIMLKQALNVNDIPGFNQGLCSIQDLSAQLAAPLLDLNAEKLNILDCCCAPGGKTAHILDLSPLSNVVALDVEHSRLEQTLDTLSRLGRINLDELDEKGRNFELNQSKRQVSIIKLDAKELSQLAGSFDRILVDAPCSGTGVIRRHPDIKWLRRDRDIENLKQVQAQILDAAFAKLKPQGILVYTTCSILPDENEEQVKAFLERHKDAHLKAFTIDNKQYDMLQRLPSLDENNLGDGFFYARFYKA